MNEPEPKPKPRTCFPVVMITLNSDEPDPVRRRLYNAGIRFLLEQWDFDFHPFRTRYELDKFMARHNMAVASLKMMTGIRIRMNKDNRSETE